MNDTKDELHRRVDDFAVRSFRDMADGDYIAARLACRSCCRSSCGLPSRPLKST